MKFLIAGLGSIGRRHLRNLEALGMRDIVLYRTHQSTLPENELAAYPVETDLSQALAHKPDAGIISNPTSLHIDTALQAANAGCHIFLEKPVSHTLDRINELKSAVQHGGGQVLVGYQFRFHPGLEQVYQWLGEGAIGRPISVRAHWGEYLPGWHPWEDYRKGYSARSELGGGVILTLSHPFDYLRWLLGEISDLWAFSGKLSDLDLDVEDTAEIGLRFASGVIGSLHLDYNQRPPAHHLEIIGTRGTIRWDNQDGSARLFQSGSPGWQVYPAPPNFERNDLFIAQMKHFIDLVQRQAAPRCSLKDGIRALELALAAQQSQLKGEIIHL